MKKIISADEARELIKEFVTSCKLNHLEEVLASVASLSYVEGKDDGTFSIDQFDTSEASDWYFYYMGSGEFIFVPKAKWHKCHSFDDLTKDELERLNYLIRNTNFTPYEDNVYTIDAEMYYGDGKDLARKMGFTELVKDEDFHIEDEIKVWGNIASKLTLSVLNVPNERFLYVDWSCDTYKLKCELEVAIAGRIDKKFEDLKDYEKWIAMVLPDGLVFDIKFDGDDEIKAYLIEETVAKQVGII